MRSLHLQLPDLLYQEIAQAAAASGQTVESVVVDQLVADFTDTLPSSFWTPELLASIDAAAAEADLGGSMTVEQVKEHRLSKSREWRASHPA